MMMLKNSGVSTWVDAYDATSLITELFSFTVHYGKYSRYVLCHVFAGDCLVAYLFFTNLLEKYSCRFF